LAAGALVSLDRVLGHPVWWNKGPPFTTDTHHSVGIPLAGARSRPAPPSRAGGCRGCPACCSWPA